MAHSCKSHSHCVNSALAEAEAHCRAQGLRFTDIRRRVFSIIWQSHKALTAHDIMEALGNSQPPITYRALEFLHGNGLVHHVASLNAYVGCPHVGKSHTGQLLVCTDCRTVKEVCQEAPHLNTAAEQQGFKVQHMQVEVLGLCKTCQQKAA